MKNPMQRFMQKPKIAAQMIVFNAESVLPKGMLRAQLEQLVTHFDEVIIVEGASFGKGPRYDGNSRFASRDGRSTDSTVKTILQFPDPEKKITLIQSAGFWDGKVEMCNAALKEMDGCQYVWQIDSDEFYHADEISRIKLALAEKKPDAVHFRAYHFWGGFTDCMTPESGKAWGNDQPWRRIFRLSIGAQWKSHEPPNLIDKDGKSMNDGTILSADDTRKMGVMLHHYGYAVESQMKFKLQFYARPEYFNFWMKWKKDKATKIHGALTEPFSGNHPDLVRDIISLNKT